MNIAQAFAVLGFLGFDTVFDASRAVLQYSDWRERWDCVDMPNQGQVLTPDETLAVFLIDTWRNAKLNSQKG